MIIYMYVSIMCCIMCNMKMFDSWGVKLRISTFITFIMNPHILRESPRRETPRSRTPQPERADLLIDEESIKRSSSPKSEKSVIMCSHPHADGKSGEVSPSAETFHGEPELQRPPTQPK